MYIRNKGLFARIVLAQQFELHHARETFIICGKFKKKKKKKTSGRTFNVDFQLDSCDKQQFNACNSTKQKGGKMPDEEEESIIYEIATPPSDNYYRRNIEHFSKNANKLRKVRRFIYFLFNVGSKRKGLTIL